MLKRFLLLILTICVVGVMVTGCKTTSRNTSMSNMTTLKYATGFAIEDIGNDCKKVTDAENQSLVLVSEGKKVPAAFEGLPQVNTPVKKVVILSVTFGALMRPLGVIDSVVGAGTLENELYIDEMKQEYTNGRIQYVGGGGMGPPDYEAIKALNPDIVFLSTGYPDAEKYYEQLKGMGVMVAVCNDFLENDPLGRLEWIKFFAAFYDMDEEAEGYFNGVEDRVDQISQQVASSTEKPAVLWASIFMGSCYVSGGESFVARMVDMAGGTYVFSDLAGSQASSISLEELYARGKDCNVFIYASTPPYINSIKEIVDSGPVLTDLPVIKGGEVYCFQPWFYQIADKPDELVQDLAYIFHPGLFPGYQLKNFMRLPAE